MRTTAATTYAAADSVAVSERRSITARIADYVELTKPRISLFVLVAVAAGYLLGCGDEFSTGLLFQALFGIALVAAGSSAINQYIERFSDARMDRTVARPIPSGRLAAGEVLAFGLTTGLVGCLYLAICVNLLTALLAAFTFLAYTLVYTPLKQVTTLNTAIGAVPGALPPILGWTATGTELDMGAFSLFAILFLWQFPHFMAIAWIYREDYGRAGMKMIPTVDQHGKMAGYVAVGYAIVLIPVSLLPARFGLADNIYTTVALLTGAVYLWTAFRFFQNESTSTARQLLAASLIYLPAVLLTMVGEHILLLN